MVNRNINPGKFSPPIKFSKQDNPLSRSREHFNCEKSSVELYHCTHCNNFPTPLKIILKKHIAICHTADPLNRHTLLKYSVRNYVCKTCSFRTHSPLSFIKHTVNCNLHLTILGTETDKLVNLPPKNGELFECDQCSYHTPYKSNVKTHIQVNHQALNEVWWFQCEHCTYKTKYKSGLNAHIKYKHTPESLINWQKCGKCDFKTKGRSILKRHIINKHTSEEKVTWFTCDQCPYKTKRKDTLQNHLLYNHFKDLWYECER